MTTIFNLIESTNHEKIVLYLDKEEDSERLQGILAQRYSKYVKINTLGTMNDLISVQYALAALINCDIPENKEGYRKVLWVLLKYADKQILDHADSEGNNCLHYSAVLGDYDICKYLIQRGVNKLINKSNKKADVYAKDPRSRNALEIYCNTSDGSRELEMSKNTNFMFERQIEMEGKAKKGKTDSSSSHSNDSLMNKKPYKFVETDKKIENDPIKDDAKVIQPQVAKQSESSYSNAEENHKVTDFEIKNLLVKKYPGKLYITVNTIIGFISEKDNVKSIAVKVCVDNEEQTTGFYALGSFIEMGETLIFQIKETPIKIKVFMIVEYADTTLAKYITNKRNTKKVLKAKTTLLESTIDKYHNKLVTHEFQWEKYDAPNFLFAVAELFGKKEPNASLLNTFISYISDDELQHINAPMPCDLYSVTFWIKYRQNSFVTWYKGYVAIRGERSPVATHLWKRRYIQWHGYNIMIFNDTSGALIGTLDIKQGKHINQNDNEKKFCPENTVRLKLNRSIVEFQFDNKEKFDVAVLALESLLFFK